MSVPYTLAVIDLCTQKDLRRARGIGFCCICGKPFVNGEKRTRQHVPPRAIFAEEDRTPPLILPAHEKCNGDQSPLDTVIGQLVAVLHRKYPKPDEVKLEVDMFQTAGGGVTAGVKNLPLRAIIFRWVRYFHAALYGTYLEDKGGMIFEPFPAGDFVDGQLVYAKTHVSRAHLTHVFKQQLKAGRTDGITCYNGKCQYRCTWLTFDNGTPFCLFALRLYNWEELGDPRHPNMGCVGWYFADTPPNAAIGTRLEIAVSNFRPLDPFAP